MTKIHFIGINGSGISGVACIAKEKGYDVDGCDINEYGDYTEQLLKNNIKIYKNHSKDHLKNSDLIVVSPALLYRDKYKTIEETSLAMEQGKLIKWQEFLGKYIMKNQEIVAVSGTHGKTTTTTLMGLILEAANLDPTVFVGGTVKEWKRSYRIGNSNYFVCEADEYDGNFLHYNPKYVIVTNIEMEHPERYKNLNEYVDNFKNFLLTIQNNGKIVFNYDDKITLNLILSLKEHFKQKNIQSIGVVYNNETIENNNIKIINVKTDGKQININDNIIKYNLLGEHNARNISNAIILSIEIDINMDVIKNVIASFNGSKRRMDLIYSNNRIKLYDDYGHHYTQIYNVLTALKTNKKDNEKIIVIHEPHLISRIKNNTKEFVSALKIADYRIVTKIYKSRENFMEDVDVTKMINDNDIEYIEQQSDVLDRVNNIINDENNKKYTFIVIVMGAGNSYQIAEQLKNQFQSK